MTNKIFFLYLLIISIPVFLGALVWQSHRYRDLSQELARLEQTQREWVESNKKLIAGISEYSSPQRIDYLARNHLELRKIQPEYFLQVKITGGLEHEY